MNLNTPVAEIPFVGAMYAKRLEKLGIENVENLLMHVPSRYKDLRNITNIINLQKGQTATIHGEVTYIKNIFTSGGKIIQEAEITDNTGSVKAIWFNQIYLVKNIKKRHLYSFSGKLDEFSRRLAFISPDYEEIIDGKETIHTGRLVPIYPETARVSSKWLRARIKYVLDTLIYELEEYLPQSLLKKENLMRFPEALNKVHFPDNPNQANKAKKRLAFDEVLNFQFKSQYRKNSWQKNTASNILKIENKIYKMFTDSLPFSLTKSQITAIKEVFKDLSDNKPMNRLLEGDVGSGKTVVAAAGAFAAFVNGYQSVFMAPTQILAQQHFATLSEIFKNFKVRVSLVTSSLVKSDLGKTDIYVGTHALIHKKINFENVALVVIDEQHRFGVEQRAHLIQKTKNKSKSPHVLTMTATPIPRTIALTVYGDLDLSILTELPKGRVPITTWLVPPHKRQSAYNWIDTQIKETKVQAFIICPLIEESNVETMKQVKAVTEEYKELIKIFPDLKIGLLHGRQSANEKDKVLDTFRSGNLNILVATPVVEVGIDVPNTTLMIIEGAERFGLAQLHQLRGRIGRGTKKSYCLLFTQSRSPNVLNRLEALKKSLSGFELAELDLKLRGPGELYGFRQHGFPELKIASWQDTELIKTVKYLAEDVVKSPKKYPKIISKLRLKSIALN